MILLLQGSEELFFTEPLPVRSSSSTSRRGGSGSSRNMSSMRSSRHQSHHSRRIVEEEEEHEVVVADGEEVSLRWCRKNVNVSICLCQSVKV